MKKKNKPNCYKCKYRGKVSGSAHSCCNHPNRNELKVKGNQYGIKSGWFFYPFNFDPTWLETCNGFVSKEAK